MVTDRPSSEPRPNIAVVAGMPRGGTTSLYHILQDHPSAFLPFRKESSYFIFHYERGPAWYHGLYRKMRPDQVGFDITPAYFFDEIAIRRIRAFDPDAKVILIIRDPAEWVVSFYRIMCCSDFRIPPFEQFLEGYTYRVGKAGVHLEFTKGLATRMIDRYREAFGDNLLLLDFRLFRSNLLQVVRAIESFVGLSPHFNQGNLRNVSINAGNKKNIRLISYLLSRERFISLLHTLFPEDLLRFLRKQFDLLSVRNGASTPVPTDASEQNDLAQNLLAAESETVSRLFAQHPILLGSGKPFAVAP